MRYRLVGTLITGGVAAAAALLAGIAPAAAERNAATTPPPSYRAHVTFTARGSYEYTVTSGSGQSGHITVHVPLTLHTDFQTRLVMTSDGPALTAAQGTLSPPPGTFHLDEQHVYDQSSNSYGSGTCDGELPVGGSAPAPRLRAGRTGTGLAMSLDSLTGISESPSDYSCPSLSSGGDMNPAGILGVINQAAPLPDSLSAHLTVPDAALQAGYFKANVSSRPIQANCTKDFGSGDPCSQSLTWTGVVTIHVTGKECKKPKIEGVEGSNGQPLSSAQREAMGLGADHFTGGDHITVPAGQTIRIQLGDGSVIQVDGGSEFAVPVDCDGVEQPSGVLIDLQMLAGRVWGDIAKALKGNPDDFQVSTERSALGVRGSVYTMSVNPKTGAAVMHVLEGSGYARLPNGHLLHFSAGQGIQVGARGPRLTRLWPAADQAFVPPAYRPAKLTGLSLTIVGQGGHRARLHLHLDRAATLLVRTVHAGHTVATRTFALKAGRSTVAPFTKDLAPGAYKLALQATTRRGSVSLAALAFRLR